MEENVTKEVRWLNSVGVKSHVIATCLGLGEAQVHKTLDDEEEAVKALKTHYTQFEHQSVLSSIKEWQNEFDFDWRVKVRKEYVQDRIEQVRALFFEGCKELVEVDKSLSYWHVRRLERLEKLLQKLGMEAKILMGKAEGLTPEKIAKARTFPITDLIQTRQGVTKCPFHQDRSPSLDVRKNFYYCYGCGAHGDVIDFVMKTKGISFREAVTLLI